MSGDVQGGVRANCALRIAAFAPRVRGLSWSNLFDHWSFGCRPVGPDWACRTCRLVGEAGVGTCLSRIDRVGILETVQGRREAALDTRGLKPGWERTSRCGAEILRVSHALGRRTREVEIPELSK